MVLTKHVTEEDVDRILLRYLELSPSLVTELETSESLGDMRSILFEHARPGADISFVLMYDWAIRRIVQKILEIMGKKKDLNSKQQTLTRVNDTLTGLGLRGQITKITDSAGTAYGKRETLLLKRMNKLGYDIDLIYSVYKKSYDGRSKEAIASKIKQL